MKKLLFSASLVVCSVISLAQPSFQWVNQIGSTGYDKAIAQYDKLGNVIVAGHFYETVDFDPGSGTTNLTSIDLADVFVAKYNSEGALIWAIQIGDSDDQFLGALSQDNSGNIFITGTYSGTVDFDPGAGNTFLTSVGGYDTYVAKFDKNGDLIWAKSFGGSGWETGESIAISSSGDVVFGGSFEGTADFDPSSGTSNLISNGDTDAFVTKLTSNGDYGWSKGFGNALYNTIYDLDIDDSENIFITGYIEGTVDLDPGSSTVNHTSAGKEDIFVLKLDGMGDYSDSKSWGSTERDFCNDLQILNNNVFMVGGFSNTVDFDLGPSNNDLTSSGWLDIFIVKYDNAMNLQWASAFNGSGYNDLSSLDLDNNSNVYITGNFKNTVDFDPGTGTFELTAIGGEDVFISKLKSNGDLDWVKQLSGSSDEYGSSISTGGLDDVIVCGMFTGTTDFDPDSPKEERTTLGGTDIFVMKYASDGGTGLQNRDQVNVPIIAYPNPTSENISIELNEVYSNVQIVLTNLQGQLIQELTFKNRSHIDLQIQEPKGIYLLKVNTGEKRAVFRIVKE